MVVFTRQYLPYSPTDRRIRGGHDYFYCKQWAALTCDISYLLYLQEAGATGVCGWGRDEAGTDFASNGEFRFIFHYYRSLGILVS